MENQSQFIDSTTMSLDPLSLHSHPTARFDPNETPTVNSTNPNYQPGSFDHSMVTEKTTHELKKGQQHVEDIITKSKRILKQHCKNFVFLNEMKRNEEIFSIF